MKNNIQLFGSVAGLDEWDDNSIKVVRLPIKILFKITNKTNIPIDKILWDFGDTKKIKTPLPDKNGYIKYIYKNNCENTTISVQASASFNDQLVATNTITISFNDADNNYIDNEEFKKQILDYYGTVKIIPKHHTDIKQISHDLADAIQKIADRLAFRSNFMNYTYIEEMKGDAIIRMMHALIMKKFDPEKGNPFTYFTTIAYNAFRNRIKKEKRTRDALLEYQSNTIEKLIADGVVSQSILQTLSENNTKEEHNNETF